MDLPSDRAPGADLAPDMRRFQRWLADAYGQHPSLADLSLAEARRVAERVRAPLAQGGPRMLRF